MQYTKENEDWLIENYRLYGKHRIVEAYNNVFHENRSIDALWWKIRKLGLTGDEEYRVKRCRESFGTEIGSEHISSNGYTMVKVKDDRSGRSKNWQTKQSYIWEQNYGKIPEGYVVIFLDGDKQNFALDNLMCVPNGRLATLSKKHWYSSNKELTKTAILWCELYDIVGEAEREKYRDDTLHVSEI